MKDISGPYPRLLRAALVVVLLLEIAALLVLAVLAAVGADNVWLFMLAGKLAMLAILHVLLVVRIRQLSSSPGRRNSG